MKTKRRIKIITETERKFSFAVNRAPVRFFCSACDASVEMISINEAAKHLGKVWRDVVHLIESGEIHSTETAHGEIYVCVASLSGIAFKST